MKDWSQYSHQGLSLLQKKWNRKVILELQEACGPSTRNSVLSELCWSKFICIMSNVLYTFFRFIKHDSGSYYNYNGTPSLSLKVYYLFKATSLTWQLIQVIMFIIWMHYIVIIYFWPVYLETNFITSYNNTIQNDG